MSIKTYDLRFLEQTINAAPGEEIVIEFLNGSVRGRFYAVDVAAWRAAVDKAATAESLEKWLAHNPPPSDEDGAYALARFRAINAGWSTARGRDLCEACTAKHNEQAAAAAAAWAD